MKKLKHFFQGQMTDEEWHNHWTGVVACVFGFGFLIFLIWAWPHLDAMK